MSKTINLLFILALLNTPLAFSKEKISSSHILFGKWVRQNVGCQNGYIEHAGSPYFCNRGYIHKYSGKVSCDYNLVDLQTNSVVEAFGKNACDRGYDLCANLRNNMNEDAGDSRFFCSETI